MRCLSFLTLRVVVLFCCAPGPGIAMEVELSPVGWVRAARVKLDRATVQLVELIRRHKEDLFFDGESYFK